MRLNRELPLILAITSIGKFLFVESEEIQKVPIKCQYYISAKFVFIKKIVKEFETFISYFQENNFGGKKLFKKKGTR